MKTSGSQIEPALLDSAHLVVLSTPQAFLPRADGQPNWVEPEIDTYFGRFKQRPRITIALAAGAPDDRYPGRLGVLSQQWEWADLRRWSRWYWLRPNLARQIDDAVTKILAAMLKVPTPLVPLFREEEARRSKLRRRWVAGAAAALLLGASTAGWNIYKSRHEALQREANGVWNDLDFANPDSLAPAERNALWTLAVDRGQVRNKFVAQLSRGTKRLQRFVRHPGPVSRALGLGWPSPQQAQVLRPAIAAIGDTTDPDQLHVLAEAVKTLPVQLTDEQAQAALSPVLRAIEGTTEPFELLALAAAVQALPVELEAAQAQAALGPFLDAIKGTTEPFYAWRLAQVVHTLAGKLDAAQAQVGFVPLVDVIKRTADVEALWAPLEAVKPLAPKLTKEQAQVALNTVRPGLAWAPTSREAAGWAGALVTLLPRERPEIFVAEIVEALRYRPRPGTRLTCCSTA